MFIIFYTWFFVMFTIFTLFSVFTNERYFKTVLGSFVLYLPIYGRVLGWW